jgi:hypothetical protein
MYRTDVPFLGALAEATSGWLPTEHISAAYAKGFEVVIDAAYSRTRRARCVHEIRRTGLRSTRSWASINPGIGDSRRLATA